jgi:hypothetical protein
VKTSPKLISALLFLASAPLFAAPTGNADGAEPYTTLTTGKLLDFRYSFPTVVGTYPALLAKIRADQDAAHKQALADAQGDLEARKGQDFPFHQHQFWRDWTVTGNSFSLLSLVSRTESFTGGAHGNQGSSALLWDEKRDAAIELDRLFGGSAALWKSIQPEYCRKLVAERQRRGITAATTCPKRSELTIVPVDSDFDYHFDSLRIIADPYVAGSYAEGFYIIALPMTQTLLNRIDPAYRESFEVQRQ